MFKYFIKCNLKLYLNLIFLEHYIIGDVHSSVTSSSITSTSPSSGII